MTPTSSPTGRHDMPGLRGMLIGAFVLLISIPVLALSVAPSLLELHQERSEISDDLTQMADTQGTLVEQWLVELRSDLSQLANNQVSRPLILDALVDSSETVSTSSANPSWPTLDEYLASLDTPFDQTLLLDADGIVRASDMPSLIHKDFSSNAWFAQAASASRSESAQVIGPYRDPLDGQNSIYIALPIFDLAGEPVGVLAGRVAVEGIKDVLAAVPLGNAPTEYFVVNEGLQYVVAPESIDDGDALVADRNELPSRGLQETEPEVIDGQTLVVVRQIEPLDMWLVVKEHTAKASLRSRHFFGVQFGLVVLTMLATFAVASGMYRRLNRLVTIITEGVERIAEGDLDAQIPSMDLAELDRIAQAINGLTERLSNTLSHQEEIVRVRTRDLETTARMGHTIASQTDLQALLQVTIELIVEQLGYYHAQVFLLDDLRQDAVLRASMGPASQELLEAGYKQAVGSASVVGQAAARGEPVFASDTQMVEYWQPNPLLPDTRAEIGVPLRQSGQTVGVLNVQSTTPNAFDEQTIPVFKSLADQLAVAIRNTQLLQEKDRLLASSFELTKRLTQEGWSEYLKQHREVTQGFRYDLSDVAPLTADESSEGELHLPIALRGAIIGELSARLGEGRSLSEEEWQLISQALDRVALAVDNARQAKQTQLSLHETNRLYEATQRIASTNSLEELANSLTEIGLLNTVDRALLYLVNSELGRPNRRSVELVSVNLRDPADPLDHSQICYPVGDCPFLTFAEEAPSRRLIIDDLDSAAPDAAIDALRAMGATSVAVFTITSALSGHETLGWLVLQRTSGQKALADEDIRFLANVVDQAATALDGVRMFEQTQVRARRLQAINEVSHEAKSVLYTEIALPQIVNRINEAFDYYHVQVFLTDKRGKWAVMQAGSGLVGEQLFDRQYRLAVGVPSVVGQAIARAETIVAVEGDPLHHPDELLPDSRAEMAIPLQAGDRVIGALDLHSSHFGAFNTETQAILRSLADQITVSLENSRLFNELQDRIDELTIANFVSQSISRAQTLDELYAVVGRQILKQAGVQDGFLSIIDERGRLQTPIWIEDGKPSTPPTPSAATGLVGQVIASGEEILINEGVADHDLGLGKLSARTMQGSLLIVPMVLSGEVMGLLGIMDPQREHTFTETHVRQLTTLAPYIAVKLRNAELLEEAERRADDLGFLFEVTRTAVTGASLRESLDSVADMLVREVGPAEASAFYLACDGVSEFELVAAAGYAQERIGGAVRTAAYEVLIRAAAAGEGLLLSDLELETSIHSESTRTRSVIAIPLTSGREVVGVFTVESTQPNAFSTSDRGLLAGTSSTLTAVIDNARLLEQITRTNEQLRELDVLKSQFLANMSHELRTPLNSIIGFSRVMLKGIDGQLTDLQEQDLGTIFNSGQHLLSLINNILDLSKIEAGKMEIQSEYIDLGELLDSTIATGRGLVKDEPIEILLKTDGSLPKVYGDPVRVRQVLLNLVSNAAKFTNEGSITLRATRKPPNPATGEPPRVQVDVIDTGIGIAQEDMRKLFQAFSQVDGSATRQAGGTGLGLAITREFVELMGGRIWVQSEVGAGSTFSFTLPLHPPDVANDVPTDDEKPPYVLIVEPDGAFATRLVETLHQPPGCEVETLNCGIAALEAVMSRRPDVLIMDPDLPDMDGYGLLASLRTQDAFRDLPVVIITNRDVSGSELQQLGEGALRIFNKANGGASRLLDDLPHVLEALGG